MPFDTSGGEITGGVKPERGYQLVVTERSEPLTGTHLMMTNEIIDRRVKYLHARRNFEERRVLTTRHKPVALLGT